MKSYIITATPAGVGTSAVAVQRTRTCQSTMRDSGKTSANAGLRQASGAARRGAGSGRADGAAIEGISLKRSSPGTCGYFATSRTNRVLMNAPQSAGSSRICFRSSISVP
jgi:hypothetical protein